jgi:transposase
MSTIKPDTSWREGCRFRALELSQQGWSQTAIADALGMSQSTVSKLLKKVSAFGQDILHTRKQPGRPPRVGPAQLEELRSLLKQGAPAHGFEGDVWTSPRVASVLEHRLGVRLSDRQSRRILRQLRWSRPKPERQAIQRDAAAITHWLKHRWPYLKRYARRTKRLILFIDESGLYLLPGLVSTWAPRGETPILHEMLTRAHLSLISAVSPTGEVYSHAQKSDFDSETVIDFLTVLHRRLKDQKVLVIWDNAAIHKSKVIQQYLDDGASAWLRLEQLPAYAPELSPNEGIWRYLKYVKLRNVAAMSLALLLEAVKVALPQIVAKTDLVLSFFRQAGLR